MGLILWPGDLDFREQRQAREEAVGGGPTPRQAGCRVVATCYANTKRQPQREQPAHDDDAHGGVSDCGHLRAAVVWPICQLSGSVGGQ